MIDPVDPPPVSTHPLTPPPNHTHPPHHSGPGGQAPQHDYCFLDPVWRKLFPDDCTFELTRIFRQAEQRLVALLNDVRKGTLSPASLTLLRELSRPLRPPAGIEPTLLFPTNERVDAVNAQRLAQLPGQERVYDADDSGAEPFLSQVRRGGGDGGWVLGEAHLVVC